jgi:hypothetical protein
MNKKNKTEITSCDKRDKNYEARNWRVKSSQVRFCYPHNYELQRALVHSH